MATHSLIHLFHASIHPNPHLVSVFALNLFLDYLNQRPPCTCQTRSCPGSHIRLYLIEIAGLWPVRVRREAEGRRVRGGGQLHPPMNCELLLQDNISQIKWWENQRSGRVSANPAKPPPPPPFKVHCEL